MNADGDFQAEKVLSRQRSVFRHLPRLASSFRLSKRNNTLETKSPPAVPGKSEQEAGFVSKLFFWWVNPLVELAYKQPLVVDNLWGIKAKCKSSTLTNSFETEWAAEMQKPKEKRSLLKTLWRVFHWEIIRSGLLTLIQYSFFLVTPTIIRFFLQWMEDDEQPKWRGFMYAGLLFAVSIFVNGVLSTHLFMALYTQGMNVRTVLNAAIYRKSLNLSNISRQHISIGKVVTLMSNDTEKLPSASMSYHNLWVTPIFLAFGITLLVQLVGYAAIAGLSVLVFSIPIQGKIALKSMIIQRMQMKGTDERVKLLNEIFQGMKIVKFYAWEASFKDRVTALRKLELKQIKKYAVVNAVNKAVMLAVPFLMVLLTLLVFSFTNGDFKPDVIFPAVALLYVIRFPLFMLPMAISGATQALVAMKRIKNFLELSEVSEDDRAWNQKDGTGKGNGEIVLKDASFTWAVDSTEQNNEPTNTQENGKKAKKAAVTAQKEEEKNADAENQSEKNDKDAETAEEMWNLEVPSLKVSGNELMGVVGMVGSGKSSLVSAFLGDVMKIKGDINITGSIAYVAQTAWIVNATVRQNILMGNDFDEEKYNAVIEACALSHDLQMLQANDQTEIGEKGINLSGGQKQRISLARAAYADADIYILDDPLSAVDAHVGRHIFEKLILKRLSGKTRILCTNQLHFIPQVDRVLVLNNGKITESGTYEVLMSSKGAFSELMDTFEGKQEETESKEDGPEIETEEAESQTGKPKTEGNGKGKLIQEEGKIQGSVKWQVFKTYLVEGTGGWGIPILLLAVAVVAQASSNVFEWWLSYWTQAYLEDEEETTSNMYFYTFTYFGLAMATVSFVFMRGFTFALQAVVCSGHMHNILVNGVIRATSSFFDTTPIGRILNRFSKDMNTIDLLLPMTFPVFVIMIAQLIGTIVTMVLVLPWFGIPIIPIMLTYYSVQKYFRPVSRDLQRLESMSRSPIFAQFSETLNGVSTVRAFNLQERFVLENEQKLDSSNKAFYLMHACNRWLQLRLEVVGSLITLACALLLAASKITELISVTPGVAGLMLTYCLQITSNLNMTVRMGCQTEAYVTSAERIKEYSKLQHEAPETNEDYRPPVQWPSRGEITIKDLSMRYRAELGLVLKNVALKIGGGEKIGIAGRTGSGKSSLMMALFRLVEPASGTIFIDGIDCGKLGLKDLRSALSIIPQDPVMFCGTLRENLDPFSNYEDKTLWDAIRSAHLHEFVSSNDSKLEMVISEGGENLSLGQRQLVCLARAILRRNKILVMDEATANIDMETDALIQKTIRNEFKDCTVLTIAHRLHTIMDCDKILIMEEGKVGEFDHPSKLLEKEGSLLSSLVDETGAGSAKKLKEIADSSLPKYDAEKGPSN